MKITAKLLDHDTATKFGHASGPCVSPPEEEYRTETWEVTILLHPDEDSWDDITNILGDPEAYAIPAIENETGLDRWEYEDGGEHDLKFQSPRLPREYGSLVFTFGIVATQPFRHTGGLYERIA